PQFVAHLAAALCLAPACGAATPGEVEFFESRIRPVLAQDCYECHRTGGKTKGGLALDHRAGLLKGGERGPAIVPGDPARSVLMAAIRHTGEELQMPRKGAQLEAEIIADFEKWIAMGAPDPRDAPPAEAEVAADTDWSAVMRRRKSWWSFQPVASPAVPEAGDSPHPVDRFVAAALEDAGLRPAGPADRRTLIRRLSFALRGLPPSSGEVREFCDDQRPDSYERLVDRYLSSPQFGERWARHWMDWLRYADSHGSEGDPMIANAWRYRDYLIRALNAGVPYDQLVREHLAGDLLEDPRVADGINESMLGTAHLRMVFHGFAPTDALDEQVRFTDDQINVLTKGFLGLTVSCARCHDHKFDAISQADYYALYGILASTKPGVVDARAVAATPADHAEEMARVKTEMRRGLAAAWTVRAGELGARLAAPGKDLAAAVEAAKQPSDLLYLLRAAGKGRGLSKAAGAWRGQREALRAHRTRPYAARWNLGRQGDLGAWRSHGRSTGRAAGPGEITIAPEGGKIIAGLYPSGTYSHLLSTKDRGVLLSPQFELDGKYRLFARVAGDGEALVRYSVQNYPRKGTVFPITPLKDGKWRWVNYGLDYWEGDRIHLEATTAADQPVEVKNNVERSWYGVQEVVIVKDGEEAPPAGARAFVEPVLDALGEAAEVTREDVLRAYGRAAAEATRRWRDGTMSDAEAELLAALLEAGLLPNTVEEVPAVKSLLEDYRRLEGEIAVPIRAPGVWEAPDPADQPLFVRGDHKQPAGKVPRRFLEAIDPEPYRTRGSGRRELAADFLRPDNPFTSRVIVN
ncbi:MAG: DUF1549 domain-containing protein, partial [Akkermansiaceae bacterium]|nr:DUF1549 domain-containing protein [Akkermansiaceae bacterium]